MVAILAFENSIDCKVFFSSCVFMNKNHLSFLTIRGEPGITYWLYGYAVHLDKPCLPANFPPHNNIGNPRRQMIAQVKELMAGKSAMSRRYTTISLRSSGQLRMQKVMQECFQIYASPAFEDRPLP